MTLALAPAAASLPRPPRPLRTPRGAAFFLAAITLALAAAALAGFTPLGFSIVTVFLFAGPHNWMEAHFFLSQMPARWGPMRRYFQLAIAGVLTLALSFFLIPVLARTFDWQDAGLIAASATWNSALILWITTLATLHAKNRPASSSRPTPKSRGYLWPIAFLLVALIWAIPAAWNIALVYIHPIIAILFLQRILAKKRPALLPAYYILLALIPLILGLLWWRFHDAPPLEGQDMLTMRITRHAGAEILPAISAHFLVSAHTFLEMLHYGVWLVAIPLFTLSAAGRRPWHIETIPLAKRSLTFRTFVAVIMLLGIAAVLFLWAAFLADYPITRDIYFTVAILHVLAEFPFLVRLL